jgi:hypothetical protein
VSIYDYNVFCKRKRKLDVPPVLLEHKLRGYMLKKNMLIISRYDMVIRLVEDMIWLLDYFRGP